MDKSVLMMPFLDAGESFCNGFECGMLWQMFKCNESMENRPIHLANKEQISLMCDHYGYEYKIIDCGDGCWCFLTANPINISSLIKQ